jgi:hypothetical protein
MDEIKVYNYSLSAEQIYQDYLAGEAGKTSSYLHYDQTYETTRYSAQSRPATVMVRGRM